MSMLDADDIDWGDGQPKAETRTAPEAYPDPQLFLGVLLRELEAYICDYVAMTYEQATAVTLWTAHTHVLAAADCTPYLQINSATARAGKTRLLEVLEPVVLRPWFTGRTTAAALMRKIDAESPTLLLDESDATFKGVPEYAEALRGVLNSGYRRSGKATVCIGQGANVRANDFTTFCPKAIAGIGKLPDTVADRSIPIVLKRRKRDEPVRRWRDRDGRREAAPLYKALVQWSGSAVAALRDARPELPLALGDRAQDVWEPLIAIADHAGGLDWPSRARDAAVLLMTEVDDDAMAIQLLADVREIFGDAHALASRDILEQLTAIEARPWATWSKGKPMTGHALARLLKPFGVVPPGNIRFGETVAKSYRRATFEDAWERYLPAPDTPEGDQTAPRTLTSHDEEEGTDGTSDDGVF